MAIETKMLDADNSVPPIAPKTYSGLLDDVVERYPISGSIASDFLLVLLSKTSSFQAIFSSMMAT